MLCPRCGDVELEKVHSQLLDECPRCGGVWYETDELRLAKDAAAPDLNWLDFEFWKHEDQARLSNCETPCPSCNSALVSFAYGKTGVQVDVCPSCQGIWLDRGEFEKIVQALEDEATSMDLSDYLRAAITEAREVVTGPENRMSEWRDFKGVLHMMALRLWAQNPKLLKRLVELQKSSPFR